ncbi:MAG: PQQ-like beta-propeller repeat protein [Verrucomicrobiae bacterium]|nr:PQQ-like beta-propeller repeat protein [Verrucomicrobiae bacterium]
MFLIRSSALGVCGLALGWLNASAADWTQWRGPDRTGIIAAEPWPSSLDATALQRLWRIELGPSYSGPVVADGRVFVTESKNDTEEHVRAFDRQTGAPLWQTHWQGFVRVPFFARRNGDWIRATPAWDAGRLYVAGMRDRLVCLDASTGAVIWEKDFVSEFRAPVPEFGFVSSPLVSGDTVVVQAGASVVCLDKQTGTIRWRTLQDGGGMWGSAFSSPVRATLAGQDQFVVQTRDKLAGVQPDTGQVLWEQPVKAFRGMNILTPLVRDDRVFTSAYGGRAHQFRIARQDAGFSVEELWSARAEGYMASPLLIEGHLYLHLRNQRVVCLDWETGAQRWESGEKFGRYWSLAANGRQILALDEDRTLHLVHADPATFRLAGSQRVAEEETWAHLAVSGTDLFVRDLAGLTVLRWRPAVSPTAAP